MKRLLLSLLVINLSFANIRADEGMWLPLLIKERIADMQQKGFKLTAQDLYSVNKASLKDAIVHFGGGCTGELISDKGLLLTNHHCGFSQIQSHSSVEHDYLKDGFWAMTQSEELPNKNLTVRFLVRMEDVTDKILEQYQTSMTETQRDKIIFTKLAEVIKEATLNNHYEAKVESLYYGNQYFLFVYETFTDVRLVGAPPSSIGKFGGDTDNWMWPRHTGDFSLFRIYADKENKPAPYSKDNVPYTPKRHFAISTKGVNEGDFTLVYGYPGRTQQYVHSQAVRYILEKSNPNKINLRALRLAIQREEMAKSQEVRIKYASKNASVSNAWKKWQGESKGIVRLNTIESKMQFEEEFEKWAKGKPDYNGLLRKISLLYSKLEPYAFATEYYNEAIISNEIIRLARDISHFIKRGSKMVPQVLAANVKSNMANFYKNYYLPIDKKSFIAIVSEYDKEVPNDMKPTYFRELKEELGSIEKIADQLFSKSLLADSVRAYRAIKDGVTEETFINDPAFMIFNAFNENNLKNIKPYSDSINNRLSLLYRTYMKGQMEFSQNRDFYPDANSTLRIAYGNVQGYSPADAIYYNHYSTIEGIMEKDNPDIYDYNIPQALRDVYAKRDFGKWTQGGTVPVCFVATNHTSGGNSGSPIINANGELIGINFDRVWEGTMSDIAFDPQMCRNISLDIRYALFIIEKVVGAS
ncbi:MAG: S46 family peptidase, partial [Bacteroidales bacterium]